MRYFFLALCWGIFFLPTAQAQAPAKLAYENYQTLGGHTSGGVQNLRFSPDGKILATAGLDKVIILWDVSTGTPLKRLFGHTNEVYEVTFSDDGKLLVSASSDGTARVWEVSTGRWMGTYQCKAFTGARLDNSVSFAVFTKDNRHIIFGGNSGFLMKADISSPTNRAEVLYSSNNPDNTWYSTITGGTLSFDGKTVIISVGSRLDVVDVKTGTRVKAFRYTPAGFNDVVLGPTSNQLAAWTYNGKVTFWDYNTGQLLKEIQVTYPRNYSGATFSQDAKYLATGACDNIAKIWNWRTGEQLATLTGHSRLVRICRFNPKQDVLATASYDGTVKLWKEIEEEKEEEEVAPPPPPPTRDTVVVERERIIRDTVYLERPPKKEEVIVERPPKKEDPAPRPELPKPSFDDDDLTLGKTINLKNIQFERGTDKLLPDAYADLEVLAEKMLTRPTIEIELRGHTDNVGKQTINLRLSGDRVRVVREYLIKAGIDSRRITTRAFGGLEPIADNSKEETRRLNRRVEARIRKL
ncbi:MAG: OmpA family protein [Bernardetiaceae bacterium]